MIDVAALMPQTNTGGAKKLAPCCKSKKQWLPGTLDTTYGDDFVAKEVPIQRATRRHDGHAVFGGHFDGTTTNAADFKPWEVKREAPIRPRNTDMTHGQGFAGESMYRHDFGAKEVPYVRVKAKHSFQPNPEPLESETTNRRDFQPRDVALVAKPVKHATSIPANAGPFAGQSLYKESFQRQPFAKRDPAAPRHSSEVLPTGQFDDATMYSTSFQAKEVSRAEMLKPKDARPHSSHGWYDGAPSTEYGNQFVGREGPVARPIRAARSLGVIPTGAFDGTTNNRTDFKQYDVPRTRMIRPSPAFSADTLPFAGQSTYQANFVQQEVPYERVRPKHAYQPNTAPFDAMTTHRAAFAPKDAAQVTRPIIRPSNITTSSHAFEGSSTYKNDFTRMPGAKRVPCVPTSRSDQDAAAPFDGTTTYRLDFVEKEVPTRVSYKPRDAECESCVDGFPG